MGKLSARLRTRTPEEPRIEAREPDPAAEPRAERAAGPPVQVILQQNAPRPPGPGIIASLARVVDGLLDLAHTLIIVAVNLALIALVLIIVAGAGVRLPEPLASWADALARWASSLF